MITLSPDALLSVWVSVPLVSMLALGGYYAIRSRHRPVHSCESIYECAHCNHLYTIARNRPMDRCPRCGELNEAVRM